MQNSIVGKAALAAKDIQEYFEDLKEQEFETKMDAEIWAVYDEAYEPWYDDVQEPYEEESVYWAYDYYGWTYLDDGVMPW